MYTVGHILKPYASELPKAFGGGLCAASCFHLWIADFAVLLFIDCIMINSLAMHMIAVTLVSINFGIKNLIWYWQNLNFAICIIILYHKHACIDFKLVMWWKSQLKFLPSRGDGEIGKRFPATRSLNIAVKSDCMAVWFDVPKFLIIVITTYLFPH